ncbi:Lrp/AsnC family transcriptional regulator [Burkholderia gladioli pv. gladioli]|uniref:AsnC family protein n=1 Tax=Burkholderia gladioli TaxID=28095 RepID=A0A095F1H4_BURGA|nr:Lrp/AsnC family transcriptional regulator [Burkholderia gladioli]AJW98851.1 asnC family protein [Burkholderia gladioli]ASD79994.1 Lrp/AsnC family transcriptional regulator [Burkholderia gladioli pv. gladioli]AWY54759.1 Lrp/AsnC family transcriptional regulator [Burkholderia gladioli pv. gladioli]KGC11511.1 asnC family protein [Burkholderia gladioli]MDJ1164257.1 Lrp/AsnC family transcriptional regulator [Burkholderia gladioli pv. gladioli]
MVDHIDKAILAVLQQDSTLSVSDIADRVNLSTTPCWRRIQKLEQDGVISRRVVLLDAQKLNVGVTVLVEIKTSQHTAAWLARFCAVVASIPEVVEVYRMSGHIDYMLKVVVPHISAYDSVYKRLINEVDIFDVSSSFSMETIKHTTVLPLDYVS